MRFNENDCDHVGNPFPAVYIKDHVGNEQKFLAKDEYPRIFGLLNDIEIWDSDLEKLKKNKSFMVTPEYFQPYIMFCDDEVRIWNSNHPLCLDLFNPDFKVKYSDLKKTELSLC